MSKSGFRGGCGTGIKDDPSADPAEDLDELPAEIKTVSPQRVPLQSREEGDTTGETEKPVVMPDGRPVTVRGVVHDNLPAYRQLRDAQCAKYPCAACDHAEFLQPGGEKYKAVESMLTGMVQKPLAEHGLGIWHGLTAMSFIYCEDEPVRQAMNDHGTPIFEQDGTAKMMGGPGFKVMGHNCPAWEERTREFLPHWLPEPAVKLVEGMVRISNSLRLRGIRRAIEWMHRQTGGAKR